MVWRGEHTEMETYEVILDCIQTINRSKRFIIGLMGVALCTTFLFSSFLIDKKYQTEMWISVNDDFFYDNNEITVEYIKSHFFYPEVVRPVMGEISRIQDLKSRLHFTEVNGLIQVIYIHEEKDTVAKALEKWANYAKLKLIEEEGRTLILTLQDDISAIQAQVSKEKQKLEKVQTLLTNESVYTEIEFQPQPQNGDDSKIYIFKEVNPVYAELGVQENEIKLTIVELESRLEFMQLLLKDFKVVFQAVQTNLSNPTADLQLLFARLTELRTRFNAYLQEQKGDEFSTLSVQPFQIISAPYSSIKPVSPNIWQNVLVGGFISLISGIFIVLIVEKVKHLAKQSM